MLWILFAFLGAFSESLKDVFSKKALNSIKNIDEYVAAWSMRFFALPFLLSLLLFVEIPVIGDGFWSALLVSGGLNTITTILYMKALKLSDLSVTVPMVTFTPLFLLVTSPLIVGEFPGVFGVFGIILIVMGAYMLNIKKRQTIGFLDGDLVAVGDNATDVLNKVLARLDLDKAEVITIYYGIDTKMTEAEQVSADIRQQYPQLQIEAVQGGQPHYNYIVSVE